MTTHKLKCWPEYFEAIRLNEKRFEVRKDDRDYQSGDLLVLQKFDPVRGSYLDRDGAPVGESLAATAGRLVGYVLRGGQFGIEPGYVVMSLS